jgi:hypothetical protein
VADTIAYGLTLELRNCSAFEWRREHRPHIDGPLRFDPEGMSIEKILVEE